MQAQGNTHTHTYIQIQTKHKKKYKKKIKKPYDDQIFVHNYHRLDNEMTSVVYKYGKSNNILFQLNALILLNFAYMVFDCMQIYVLNLLFDVGLYLCVCVCMCACVCVCVVCFVCNSIVFIFLFFIFFCHFFVIFFFWYGIHFLFEGYMCSHMHFFVVTQILF